MPSPARRRHAFTLLELLVALSIIVLVLGAAYGAYAAATTSVARCRLRAAVERDARIVLRMIEREVRCVAYRPPDPKPQKPGGDSLLSEKARVPWVESSRDASECLLRVLTFGGMGDPDAPGSGQFVVTYRYDSPRKRLLRRQADRMAPTTEDSDADWLCVAQNVESVRVFFFDQGQWSEGWDAQKESELPAAVRVELTLNDPDGAPHLFLAVADVPVRPFKTRETKIEAAAEPRPPASEAPLPVNP
jgi:type II secretion system protein J